MCTSELFDAEWKNLEVKRQQLLQEAMQLKKKLNSFMEEPVMEQLLREKDRLKKELPKLREAVNAHDDVVLGYQWKLKQRRLAVTNRQVRQVLDERLKRYKKRLEQLVRLHAPEVIQSNERRMIWEIETPIEELEKFCEQSRLEEERKKRESQQAPDQALNRIAAIDEHYRQTKQCLEEAIRVTEQKQRDCFMEEMEWATQDRDHLKWILEGGFLHRDDVIRRYKTRFPEDTLADLIPPAHAQTPVVPKSNGKKRSRSPSSAQEAEVAVPADPQPWRLFITFQSYDPGQELPLEKNGFVKNLRAVLDKVDCHNLDVSLAYEKLLAVCGMSRQQRLEMKKIYLAGEFFGWRIARVGKKYRLFLSIDEEERCIRFVARPRKTSYGIR